MGYFNSRTSALWLNFDCFVLIILILLFFHHFNDQTQWFFSVWNWIVSTFLIFYFWTFGGSRNRKKDEIFIFVTFTSTPLHFCSTRYFKPGSVWVETEQRKQLQELISRQFFYCHLLDRRVNNTFISLANIKTLLSALLTYFLVHRPPLLNHCLWLPWRPRSRSGDRGPTEGGIICNPTFDHRMFF